MIYFSLRVSLEKVWGEMINNNLFAGFGVRIRERRKELNLTVPQLADKLGRTRWVDEVSTSYISNLESSDGEKLPSVPVLVALSEVLGRSTDWILGVDHGILATELLGLYSGDNLPDPRVQQAIDRIIVRLENLSVDDVALVDVIVRRLEP